MFPETGKYEYLGTEFRNTVKLYLEENKSRYKLLFFDENLPLAEKILESYAKSFYSSIHAIIGPISSSKTRKVSEMLAENDIKLPLYSISNDPKLLENDDIKIFGFNVHDKLEKLYEFLDLGDEEFDNIYLVYNPNNLNKDFGRNFIHKVEEVSGEKPVIFRYETVRRFSIILKQIEIDNLGKNHRSAIVFANLDEKLIRNMMKFIKKYHFNPDNYEMFFFNQISKYNKIDREYRNSINEINYDLDQYSEFTAKYKARYKREPSLISYAVYDALEEATK